MSTTDITDLVLPAAIWRENDGTHTNSERRVRKVNTAVAPPGEARSDSDIFLALAEKLDVHERLCPGWPGPRDAFEEWRKVSAGRLCDDSGSSYEMLDKHFAVQWPLSASQAQQVNGEAPPTTRLYADGVGQMFPGPFLKANTPGGSNTFTFLFAGYKF